jgi:hypothetical protein
MPENGSLWLLKTWSGARMSPPLRPWRCPSFHAAPFVSEEWLQNGCLAFSLNPQALRRIYALRAPRCHGAERIAD